MPNACSARFVRSVTVLLAAGCLSAFALLGATDIAARQSKETPPPTSQSVPEFMQWYETQPRLSQPVFTSGARVVVVKFTDLQCPACGFTYQAYKPVLAKDEAQFPGAVKVVTKDYPLNKECNPLLGQTIHESACEAAIALRLAAPKGKAGQLEEFLYGNQRVLTPDTVRRAASMVGDVPPAEFTTGRAAAMAAIQADVALGRAIGINSTPTFVINGVKVPRVMEPALFEAVINYELRRVGVMK
jgi:protein-disulfide isomerase